MYTLKDSEKSPFLKGKEKSLYPWQGSTNIIDKREFDRDLKLHKGKYEMFSSSFDVRICKEPNLLLESYDNLRDFRHDNAVPLLNYYLQKGKTGGKFGRLIVPKLPSSFQSWFEGGGRSVLFDASGHMTPTFEKIILEFCDLVESLIKLNLILENFDMRNMYVNIYDGVPTLYVLLTKVKKVMPEDIIQMKLSWNCPNKFIAWCEDQCNIKRDDLTGKFCAFLGDPKCTAAKLKRYPHNWNDSVKGEYLMALVGSNHSETRKMLEGSGLRWPFCEGLPQRPDSLPQLLQDILTWEEDERGNNHNVADFLSYLILIRNCYKHLDSLPNKIKEILSNRKTLIALVEIWTPYIWIKVYENVGWP